MESRFYQKNGYAIKMISRDFLLLENGARIPAIDEYSSRLSVSRWVIQTALNFLEENQCVYYEKRGVLGTFVYHLNQDKLWEYAELKPLYGLLPFPSSKLMEGLLTGLNEAFREKSAPVMMTYLPSSGARFNCLEKGECHFIVTTRLAAQHVIQQNSSLQIATEIPGAQYCKPYQLISKTKEIGELKKGMVVGVHGDSIEQNILSEILTQDKEITVKVGSYHEQMRMFQAGEINFYLYRSETELPFLPDEMGNIISLDYLGLDEDLTTPVIVVKQNSSDMKTIIQHFFDVSGVAEIQKEVVSGNIPVKYL